jgi:drug/metabolite transporter (DMT)-like permease
MRPAPPRLCKGSPLSAGTIAEFIALAAIWGSSFLFMHLGGAEFGVLPIAGARVLIGALFLMPVVWAVGQWADLRRHWVRIALIGVFNSAIPFVLFAYAVTSISTGLSGILNATVPLFGALVAWAWLRERPDGSRMLGLAIGFLGILMLSWDKASFHAGGSGWAVLACLGATLCYGLSANATKKYLSGIPPMATAAGSQIGATLALALPTALTWPTHMPGLQSWGALLILGVLCSGVAYILYFRLIQNLGPARAVTVTFLVPVFAVIYGALLLGEAFSPWMLACGLVVVLGTALASGVLLLGRKR